MSATRPPGRLMGSGGLPAWWDEACRLHADGLSPRQIATRLGYTVPSVMAAISPIHRKARNASKRRSGKPKPKPMSIPSLSPSAERRILNGQRRADASAAWFAPFESLPEGLVILGGWPAADPQLVKSITVPWNDVEEIDVAITWAVREIERTLGVVS